VGSPVGLFEPYPPSFQCSTCSPVNRNGPSPCFFHPLILNPPSWLLGSPFFLNLPRPHCHKNRSQLLVAWLPLRGPFPFTGTVFPLPFFFKYGQPVVTLSPFAAFDPSMSRTNQPCHHQSPPCTVCRVYELPFRMYRVDFFSFFSTHPFPYSPLPGA